MDADIEEEDFTLEEAEGIGEGEEIKEGEDNRFLLYYLVVKISDFQNLAPKLVRNYVWECNLLGANNGELSIKIRTRQPETANLPSSGLDLARILAGLFYPFIIIFDHP